MSDDLDQLVTSILARPLGEIVAARDEAVRRLKSEKRAAEAAELARLRRPSPPLWAANRLQELDPGALRELLDAGAAVRAAQAALLAGEPDAVQRLTESGPRFNAAVGGAAQTAFKLLVAEGHGAGADTERRLQSMLRAAAVGDDETCAAILAGRLLSEPQPAGFDPLAGAPLGTRPPDVAPPPPEPSKVPEGKVERLERRRELQRAVGERREAHAQAEREAAARRARAAELARDLTALQRRVASLQKELDAQREAVVAAEALAREALAALNRATAALDG